MATSKDYFDSDVESNSSSGSNDGSLDLYSSDESILTKIQLRQQRAAPQMQLVLEQLHAQQMQPEIQQLQQQELPVHMQRQHVTQQMQPEIQPLQQPELQCQSHQQIQWHQIQQQIRQQQEWLQLNIICQQKQSTSQLEQNYLQQQPAADPSHGIVDAISTLQMQSNEQLNYQQNYLQCTAADPVHGVVDAISTLQIQPNEQLNYQQNYLQRQCTAADPVHGVVDATSTLQIQPNEQLNYQQNYLQRQCTAADPVHGVVDAISTLQMQSNEQLNCQQNYLQQQCTAADHVHGVVDAISTLQMQSNEQLNCQQNYLQQQNATQLQSIVHFPIQQNYLQQQSTSQQMQDGVQLQAQPVHTQHQHVTQQMQTEVQPLQQQELQCQSHQQIQWRQIQQQIRHQQEWLQRYVEKVGLQQPEQKPMIKQCEQPERQLEQNSHQPAADPGHGVVDAISTLLLRQSSMLSLPKRDLKEYNGDPLQFCSFMQSFKYSIEGKVADEIDKLYFLDQYTTGAPNRVVKGFLNRGEKAYEEAKNQLKKQFGNVHIIAEAFKNKAQSWPDSKRDDSKSWSSFSTFLGEYWNTMVDLSYTNEVDHSSIIKCLVNKLPYSVRNSWRNQVDKVMEENNRVAGFKDFLTFVEKQTRILSNPLYGDIQGPPKKEVQRPRKLTFATTTGEKNKVSSSNNEAKSSSMWCYACENKSHGTQDCKQLKKQTYDQRMNTIRSMSLCFGCLRKGTHQVKDCKKKLRCGTCQRNHPTLLHRIQEKKEKQNEVVSTTCGLTGLAGNQVAVSAVPVTVRSTVTGKCCSTYALLDDKSTAAFCTDSLRRKLQMKGVKTRLHIQTINGNKEVTTFKLNDVQVSDKYSNNTMDLPDVFIRDLPVRKEDMVNSQDVKQYSYLNEIQVPAQNVNQTVELLIGSNVPQALEPIEVIHSQGDGPFACRTALGWEIHGVSKQVLNPRESVHRIYVHDADDNVDLNRQMINMFNQDFVENSKNDVTALSYEDKEFLSIVENSAQLVDGHYQIALPLRDRTKVLTNNKVQALQRAEYLKKKFKKNTQFKEDYQAFMDSVLGNNYAEKIPDNELDGMEGKKWYIPHHGVYHPTKCKLRVVYDCAASYKGCCLNHELLQGPDLANTLVGVLLRFRQEPIAMMADVEAMFSQVKIPKEDRDYLRFLWWPNGDDKQPLEEYRMTVHPFGAKSSPSCANYALKQVAESYSESQPEVSRTIDKNFYVDDCLSSVSTKDEGVVLAKDLQTACQSAGFHLTKWLSNDREVLESIPKEERAKDFKELNLEDDVLPSERALGLQWQVQTDTLGFTIAIKNKPTTRRGILSVVSSVYDPLGLVSPAVLPAKKVIQNLCRLNLGWDEEIPSEYKRQWTQWLIELPTLSKFSVHRCFKPADFGKPINTQLHHFSDASETGYGVVSYVRMQNDTGYIHCSLVMSKSRVTHMKQITIPRLELTAATVAVRLNNKILREIEIPIDNVYFWTDSTTVLRYIANESRRYQTFVANRVAVIRDCTEVTQLKYVNTDVNPADICSRGQSIEKFVDNTASWISGPEFLKHSVDCWPKQDVNLQISISDPEVKKDVTVCAVRVILQNEYQELMSQFFEHYSDFHRLKRAVAWLLRWKKLLMARIKQKRNQDQQNQCSQHSVDKHLSVEEMKEAECVILKVEQQKYFNKEIQRLLNDDQVQADKRGKSSSIHKSSPIYRLDPILEDGLLKVGGRLRRSSSLTEEAKHPIILPKYSHVSDLILRQSHEITGHCGRNHLLSHMHQRYWIIGANSAARKLMNKCIVCRKQRAKIQGQKMADLPSDRLESQEPPFTRVGMDYFGPITVKQGRSVVKRYGVIFTCLAVRAIHIETANSLDTDSCISAIRRFIARRGQVRVIRSDNGTNIVGAQKELSKEINNWNQSKISNDLLQNNIQWKFNPPGASHFGGIWERQIRSIRKLMITLSKEQTMSDESLRTLLCEIESIINSRPLTSVSSDAQDLEPLTPNHLLLLKTHQNLAPVAPEHTGVNVRKRWKQVQYMADVFWRRWLKEYLPQLQLRQKWVQPQRNLNVGDLVLIVNESAPRNSWITGRILETYPDTLGHVRQVKLRTKSSVLTRPIHKLCLLLEDNNTQQINEPVISDKKDTEITDQEESEVMQIEDDTPRFGKRQVKPRKILDL